ncbi:hypothetical protein [Pseudomonas mangrovi]|jgi:hypothetical protein|nr:hypothetical protein [Pseudomonas mangrovi]
MMALALLAGLWLPLICSYGYGRWRRLASPLSFALFAGTASVGLHLLLTTSTFLLAEAFLNPGMLQLCLQPHGACLVYEALHEWAALVLWVLFALAGPVVVARYVWRK